MPTIDILGVPHAYELRCPPNQSDAPALIFIHGWLLSRHYWQPLIERLSSHCSCLTYDLRGFGDSQPTNFSNGGLMSQPSDGELPPNSPFTLAAYARDLAILLEKLQIENAWLVGHSLGGSIALWGAHTCPDRVCGAICLNSGGGIYLKEEFERFRNFGQQLVRRRPAWLPSAPLMDVLFSRLMVERPLSREWGRQRAIDFVRADRDAAIGTLLDSTTEAEVHLLPQIVSQLAQSVYFIAGACDRIMEPKYVNYLASFHPLFACCGQNVIEIPRCGHLSMVECPDVVAESIAKILGFKEE